MATPVFCCGFECGVEGTTGQHWDFFDARESFSTSTVRSGARSLRINLTGTASTAEFVAFVDGRSVVARFYIRFASLPSASCLLFGGAATEQPGVYFNSADSKIYAGSTTAKLGATGVSVTTGVWYRIDVNIQTVANPWTIQVKVDGTDCGTRSTTLAAENMVALYCGSILNNVSYDVFYDDVIVSYTSADYPIGPGKVEHFVPTADGTHNVAGGNDFERSNSGTDINNATTTAFQLIDDVPLKSGVVSEYINLIAPPNATDYVEVVVGPAPGISTPTIAPRAVEAIVAHASSAAGTHNLRIALNDNGTVNDVLNTNTAPGTTAAYARKHYATGPAGAWVIGGGGNGDFTDLRLRCFTSDPAPDPWWASAMIEAEFSTVNAYTLPVDPATYNFTTQNAGLLAQRKLVATNATYSFTPADATLRRGFKLVTQEAGYSFTPADVTFSVTRKLIVTPASYSLTTEDANVRAQRKLNVTEANYSFTTEDASLRTQRKLSVSPATYSFTTADAGLKAGKRFIVDAATYSFTTQDAGILAQRKLPATNADYLFSTQNADLIYDQPGSGNYNFPVDPAVYNFATQDASIRAQRELNVDPASYSFATEDAVLRTTKIFNVSPASYSFTDGTVNFLTGLFEPTYRFKVRGAKHRFNTKPSKMIVYPKRPGDIRMYERK